MRDLTTESRFHNPGLTFDDDDDDDDDDNHDDDHDDDDAADDDDGDDDWWVRPNISDDDVRAQAQWVNPLTKSNSLGTPGGSPTPSFVLQCAPIATSRKMSSSKSAYGASRHFSLRYRPPTLSGGRSEYSMARF